MSQSHPKCIAKNGRVGSPKEICGTITLKKDKWVVNGKPSYTQSSLPRRESKLASSKHCLKASCGNPNNIYTEKEVFINWIIKSGFTQHDWIIWPRTTWRSFSELRGILKWECFISQGN